MNVAPQEIAEIAKTGSFDSQSRFLCGLFGLSWLDHFPIRTTVHKNFRKLRKFSERGIYSAQPPSGACGPDYLAAFYAVRRVRRTEVRAPFQFAAPPSTFCEKKVGSGENLFFTEANQGNEVVRFSDREPLWSILEEADSFDRIFNHGGSQARRKFKRNPSPLSSPRHEGERKLLGSVQSRTDT
jgi:hypothetical protein